MTSNPVLLIEIDPIPKCCLDANDFGIFVLTARANENDDDPFTLSSLLLADPSESASASALANTSTIDLCLTEVPYPLRTDLKERLLAVATQEGALLSFKDCPNVPLLAFIEQCSAIFRELMNVLIRERAQVIEEPEQEWSPEQLIDLQQQLEELECTCGQSSIQFLSHDMHLLTLQHMDPMTGRKHSLKLNLNKVVPYITPNSKHAILWGDWKPDWGSIRICEIFQQFVNVVQQQQRAYQELEALDVCCEILEQPNSDVPFERYIQIPRTNTSILLTLDPFTCFPKACQFIGGQRRIMEELYNNYLWLGDLSVKENLEKAIQVKLTPTLVFEQNILSEITVMDCAICYCRVLDVEFPSEPCDNDACGRFYHSSCLREWLQSLPMARKSFDRIIGTCPYCQEPISVGLLLS